MFVTNHRIVAITVICAFVACCISYVDAEAQEDVFPGQTGQQLRESLIDRYKPENVLSYDPARDSMFARVYNVQDSVYCVYTGFAIYIDPNSSTRPRTQAFEQDVNTEHTWPQSKGASSGNARSDLHHLFPTRADVNSSRSNYPFTNLSADHVTRWWRLDQNTTVTPTEFVPEWSRTNSGFARFEVRDDHKGRTARAMFYFYNMYEAEAEAADTSYFDIQKNVLYNWHVAFPPDSAELARSHIIASYQDGRENPFIVDTSLVRRAFFEDGPPVATFSGLFTFDGYESTDPCPESFPTAHDYASVDGDYVTFSAFERQGVLCETVTGAFNSRGWPQTAVKSDEHYVGFDVQASPNYSVTLSSSNVLQFFSRRSNTGPQNASVYYSKNGEPFVHLHDFQPTTTGSTRMVQMPNMDEIKTIVFRFHGWDATHSSGTMRVDDVNFTGSTDFTAPLSIDIFDFTSVQVDEQLKFSWRAAAASGGTFTFEQLSESGPTALGAVAAQEGMSDYTFTTSKPLPGLHNFRLKHTDAAGRVSHSLTLEVQVDVPGAFLLVGPYPNPFNASTRLSYSVAQPEIVRIEVYDALGRRVDILHDGPVPAHEDQAIMFDAAALPSGLYVIRLVGKSFSATRAVTLLK